MRVCLRRVDVTRSRLLRRRSWGRGVRLLIRPRLLRSWIISGGRMLCSSSVTNNEMQLFDSSLVSTLFT